jgi:deoxyribonucleoside regulator
MVPSRGKHGVVRAVEPVITPERSKRRRGIAKHRDIMERVVLEKYPARFKRRSDREVARNLGISPQAVSSILAAAYRDEIVTPLIVLPPEKREVARLESAVGARFGLQQVLLVPGLPAILEPLSAEEHRNVHTRVLRAMARRVVEHLDGLLAKALRSGRPYMLGVAWGRTMHLIAQQLRTTARDICFPGLEVVPIVGITGESLTEPTEANVIAMRFAEAYGGKSSQLACPAFVPQEDVWLIQQLAQVRRMLKRVPTVDAVITSMGPIPDDDEAAQKIRIASDPLLNPELVKAARIGNAIGEICYSLFDEQGQEVRTAHTAIGLEFAQLRRIAADPKRQVILVAGGDRRRFAALRAALRARLASVLVSDTVTARYLVGEP